MFSSLEALILNTFSRKNMSFFDPFENLLPNLEARILEVLTLFYALALE